MKTLNSFKDFKAQNGLNIVGGGNWVHTKDNYTFKNMSLLDTYWDDNGDNKYDETNPAEKGSVSFSLIVNETK